MFLNISIRCSRSFHVIMGELHLAQFEIGWTITSITENSWKTPIFPKCSQLTHNAGCSLLHFLNIYLFCRLCSHMLKSWNVSSNRLRGDIHPNPTLGRPRASSGTGAAYTVWLGHLCRQWWRGKYVKVDAPYLEGVNRLEAPVGKQRLGPGRTAQSLHQRQKCWVARQVLTVCLLSDYRHRCCRVWLMRPACPATSTHWLAPVFR